MKRENLKCLKYLLIFGMMGMSLLSFSSFTVSAEINEDGLELAKDLTPYKASPYNNEEKGQWLKEPGSEEKSKDPYAGRSYRTIAELESQLNRQYQDTRRECAYNQAAYECSGLLMRGLYTPGGTYYVPWSVSPKAKQRGNVLSFTYLRKDLGFKRFPFTYTAGFIAYPTSRMPQKPNKQISLRALCQFPIDGYTDYRDEYGCGKTNKVVLKDPKGIEKVNTDFSERCHLIDVKTFYKWKRHYNKSHSKLFYQEQCGFDLRNKRYAAHNSFISMRATRYFQNVTGTFRHSEIITSGWPAEDQGLDVKKVPFMSFFFIETEDANKTKESLGAAQRMQKDYYDKTGFFVPVSAIKLPNDSYDEAQIKVKKEHQHPDLIAKGIVR